MNRRPWLLISSVLLASPWVEAAEEAFAAPPPFFLDKARGWFWREVPPEPRRPETVIATPKPQPPTSPSDPKTRLDSAPVPPASVPLTAAWFRKNLEHYRDRAIDDPSAENVAAYYYLQRVMLDKAHRFTDVARQVVMADPNLDENRRRPIATFAANEANRLAGLASEQALSVVAQQAGLLFFFRSDCPYCHVQAPLLKLLEQRFGFKVVAVSLDGRPMPGDLYLDFRTDQGQAAVLGVQSTPALFLMKPPETLLPLSQGALSLDDLTARILTVAHGVGWIDEALFETTRGQRSLSDLWPASAEALSPEALDDPLALIQALQPPSFFGKP
jgi:conjugal transfer pilus assembly protein TraF